MKINRVKKFGKMFLVLALSLVIFGVATLSATAATSPTVYFKDPALQACFIKNADSNCDGELSEAELASVTVIHGEKFGITDLTGIERWINITELYLSDNNITDVTPLENMENLYVVDLSHNSITNASPLALINSLYALDLTGNYIKDISSFVFNTGINTFKVGDNRISYIPSLKSMTSLRSINVDNNKIEDLTFIYDNSNINNISAENNKITSAEGLQNLSNISYINLCGNEIRDVAPLDNATTYRVDKVKHTDEKIDKQWETGRVEKLSVVKESTNKQNAFKGAMFSLITLSAVVLFIGIVLVVAAFKSLKSH